MIQTPMHAPETYDGLAGLHPVGRMGTISDIVDGVLYLENAPFVTGEILHIDGGQAPVIDPRRRESGAVMPMVPIHRLARGGTGRVRRRGHPARSLAAGFGRWRLVLRDELLAMRDHGELRPEADPEALSLSLLAAVQGGMLIAQTQRDPAALEAVLDAVLSHVESFAVRAD
jgi:Tetracyclin repressor-like, C-terminal domain